MAELAARNGDSRSKPIRLTEHARGYLGERGFTENDVIDAIRSGPWQRAGAGRLEAAEDFAYESEWNGYFYTTKRVRPIFVDEPTEIVVITVYTYFF